MRRAAIDTVTPHGAVSRRQRRKPEAGPYHSSWLIFSILNTLTDLQSIQAVANFTSVGLIHEKVWGKVGGDKRGYKLCVYNLFENSLKIRVLKHSVIL